MIAGKYLDRFESHIERTATCWLWRGDIANTGYGRVMVGPTVKDQRYAHRVSYEHFVGPIPVGLTIDHLCRVRACVNPAHLEAVTRGTNVLRGKTLSATHAAKTHCPAGHPYDAANTCHSGGSRICRACARLRMARRRAA